MGPIELLRDGDDIEGEAVAKAFGDGGAIESRWVGTKIDEGSLALQFAGSDTDDGTGDGAADAFERELDASIGMRRTWKVAGVPLPALAH